MGERKAGYVSTHLFRSAAEGPQLGRKKDALVSLAEPLLHGMGL